ncbi:KilA-N domain-containing protein [Yersinia kristensenii]|uniref:DNA-binding protein n=1 Tax=Yersinia kristensenii TaxID=28152 RepID=A0AB73NIS7_YERKR|nr:KilA-N domain-containing protein [Yersinia kristensenii]OVZ79554.1 DNA-binding protein [Yersinia kristensenii]
MEQLALITRQEGTELIYQRVSDGYISATALCKTIGKRFSEYVSLVGTNKFILELSAQTGIPAENLTDRTVSSGIAQDWVHPFLAINLAMWLSPTFAVKVSQWVYEWQSGEAQRKTALPAHIERYMRNRDKIPYDKFSMLNEITMHLVAPLEQKGYTLPENLLPDGSAGQLFCRWLRNNRGVDTSSFDTYTHEFIDGRSVRGVKLYPIEYYEDFRRFFQEEWIENRARKYFQDRDTSALSHLQHLLLPKK